MKLVKSLEELPLTMSVEQFAEVVGIGRNKAYELVHSKQVKAVFVGRKIIVTKAAVAQFLGA